MAPTVPIEFVGQKESKRCGLSQPMGKSRKYSKGNSLGFVPDFRHAVETMGESEGFGSSGRVDTEMTASEDSCAPKRKCISLNVDCYDGFGVPSQVLSLSKMSRLERRDLELRLKMELEQVRAFQRKMAFFSSKVVTLSPSSDIRSCNDGQKRPRLEDLHRPYEAATPQSKKFASHGRNGARTKKTGVGNFDIKPAPPVCTVAMLMKQCEMLLGSLLSHKYGWAFNAPVDVVKLKIPDYFTIITHPMDLGTVKSKLTSGEYSSPLGFAADVRLTFSNAMKYNPAGNDYHFMAKTLSKYFEMRWKKTIERKLPVTTDTGSVPPRAGIMERNETSDMQPSKKKKITPDDNKVKSDLAMRVMTSEEKQNLSTELEALLGELPESIVDFLREQIYNADQASEDEIEIDIDALSDDTLFKLRKLLDDYLLEKQKNQAKAEQYKMEVVHELGFSNSSMQQCKVDEDIDIVGGNDPPVSNFTPLEIAKDAAHKNNKCSSASSSSSELGSSSSDSGSSGSESDAVKASVPNIGNKDNLEAAESGDKKRTVFGDSNIDHAYLESENLLSQVEPNSQDKPTTAEVDGCQEGESAPPERQVSPGRLYRAALLRNRFVDTIHKAREKALEKGEKRDPEKLRMEKEELGRRHREEKARLQAEAKAAEEARRKAEAEAAVEAKKRRELEREAARQALLQMEKTVDINENSQFLEDLEMLRAAHDEVPSLIEEARPEHSENVFGSFKLQGSSNPLEQLGLFRKEDLEEEEEEETEPPKKSSPEPAKDAEEGEIGFSSFKFQGSSNPLEQLGLFRKEDLDEEEEEEIEPPKKCSLEPAKDVEEGEIGFSSFKLQGSSSPLEQLGLFRKEELEEGEEVEIEPPKKGSLEPAKDVKEGEIGFSGFKLQGNTNPLEQLGLFRKEDLEQEEEEETKQPKKCSPEPAKDVEEGEID